MSNHTVLRLRHEPDVPFDASGLTPDRLASLTASQIAALPLTVPSHTALVGDVFDVRGGMAPELRVEGAVSSMHGLGAGTSAGQLIIEGNVGDRVAAGMTGGTVQVIGNARHEAGASMSGGTLVISGSAGDRLGGATPGAAKGISGGEILVGGSAGGDVGARARRGLIVVRGGVGESAARSMIAGTLIAFGRIGDEVGRGNKRGTVLALGGVTIPATYRYACTFQSVYVRLLLTYLQRHRGFQISDPLLNGRFRRYCGDAGIPGKGEILEWVTT